MKGADYGAWPGDDRGERRAGHERLVHMDDLRREVVKGRDRAPHRRRPRRDGGARAVHRDSGARPDFDEGRAVERDGIEPAGRACALSGRHDRHIVSP